MWKYVLKRIGLALLTMFIIVTISYFLYKTLPYSKPVGTYAQRWSYYEHDVYLGYLIESPMELSGYGEVVEQITINGRDYYFYQVPIIQQYFRWLSNILTKWDWGESTSIHIGNTAIAIIKDRLPISIQLNAISILISLPLGILLGIVSALNKNTWVDHLIQVVVMIFISIPSFVLIVIMIKFLGYDTKLLPTTWPNVTDPLSQRIKGYIIPVLCQSFGTICGWSRAMRGELCEVMSSDYLLLARCKGLTKRQAIVRHAMKNAMVPLFPSILASIIGIIGGGSMIVEILYSVPGIGRLYYDAIMQKDYNVLFADMVILETFGLLIGILLDLSYGFIDPRIRMGAKKQ